MRNDMIALLLNAVIVRKGVTLDVCVRRVDWRELLALITLDIYLIFLFEMDRLELPILIEFLLDARLHRHHAARLVHVPGPGQLDVALVLRELQIYLS